MADPLGNEANNTVGALNETPLRQQTKRKLDTSSPFFKRPDHWNAALDLLDSDNDQSSTSSSVSEENEKESDRTGKNNSSQQNKTSIAEPEEKSGNKRNAARAKAVVEDPDAGSKVEEKKLSGGRRILTLLFPFLKNNFYPNYVRTSYFSL